MFASGGCQSASSHLISPAKRSTQQAVSAFLLAHFQLHPRGTAAVRARRTSGARHAEELSFLFFFPFFSCFPFFFSFVFFFYFLFYFLFALVEGKGLGASCSPSHNSRDSTL